MDHAIWWEEILSSVRTTLGFLALERCYSTGPAYIRSFASWVVGCSRLRYGVSGEAMQLKSDDHCRSQTTEIVGWSLASECRIQQEARSIGKWSRHSRWLFLGYAIVRRSSESHPELVRGGWRSDMADIAGLMAELSSAGKRASTSDTPGSRLGHQGKNGRSRTTASGLARPLATSACIKGPDVKAAAAYVRPREWSCPRTAIIWGASETGLVRHPPRGNGNRGRPVADQCFGS